MANTLNCTIVGQCYNGSASTAYGTSTAYAGFNYNSEYYTYRLQFTTPEFTGKSTQLTFNIQWRKPNVNGSTVADFSLRWALMTTDDQLSLYKDHKNEVADATDRLATGRVDLNVPADYTVASFTIETTQLTPNTTYFLYMWGDGSTGKQQNYSRATPTSNHTVVLESASTHTVTYNANGHGTAPSAVSVVDGESITLPTLTAEGFKFLGWATSSTATSGMTGTYTPTASVTLYAVWKAAGSYVYYNDNGTAVKCELYYNNNGNAVRCDVYYNDNGTAVKM